MIKLNYFYLFCCVICLMACASDDDNSNDELSTSDLLGTWVGVDLDYSGNTTFEYLGIPVVSQFTGEAYDIDYTITFTDNPNQFYTNGTYSMELTTTFLGETEVSSVENLEFLGDGTWSLSGSELTIERDGFSSVATVTLVSNDVIEVDLMEEQSTTLEGVDYIVNVHSISTFERQ
ncbi:lipocalin family protein [Winogradskyella eckloniae]|uniref:lipocalin family protein n=1 Tax=Winogradskyella eckloniae TaxID=1089306 RepID=UPI00156471FD|nr:lipocalin family protein [Winogradskyella eckloniae]NRD19938.1 lipocalin family protein [Winogradskyella eckloniae]